MSVLFHCISKCEGSRYLGYKICDHYFFVFTKAIEKKKYPETKYLLLFVISFI